jgi:peptidoglycan/LPS O-acetylase OafA/YrhL
MGIFTYGFYVRHPAVLNAISKNFAPAATLPIYIGQALYVFLFVLVLSVSSYFLVERPFERMKSLK